MNDPDWLDQQPRFALGHWPTPLELMPRLSEELGGPRIWVKRDDCSGLATGGNKTRKLEYLIGEAIAAGADCVVTYGAVQSNHARQTAAACARAGLDCHLILTRQVKGRGPDYETGGNVLLDRLLGAQVHLLEPQASDEAAAIVARLEADGRRVCQIPPGGSNATGALGYVRAAFELAAQCNAQGVDLTHLIHASSSGGTQAGLLFGLRTLDGPAPRVVGINVYHPDPENLKRTVNRVLGQLQARFPGLAQEPVPALEVNHAYLGAGYGDPSPETVAALEIAARLEGLLFDPVYSGKALAALIDQIGVGGLRGAKDVIMLHTGGAQALTVYQDRLG